MTKDSIKDWLKRSGKDRAWLADQLKTEVKTVNNWLSSARPIPEAKLALINRLHADDVAEEARKKQLKEPSNTIFNVEVDHARFRRYNAAAAAQRKTMEQWTIETLDEAVENISATGLSIETERFRLNAPAAKYTTGGGHPQDTNQHDTMPSQHAAQEQQEG